MSRLILFLALMAPGLASAQLYGVPGDSPLTQTFEFKIGPYTPGIDSEGGSAYADIFGDEGMVLFRIEYAYVLWRGVGGMVSLGGEVGYGSVTGNALDQETGSAGVDETSLNIVPFGLTAGYYLDTWGDIVPLVPYFKLGLDYTIWWVTNGVGDTSSFAGSDAAGDTWGLHTELGIRIPLDFFAPKMAQSFDSEVGVNNSYLFAVWYYGWDDDFGSEDSWQLGDSTALFGLAFDF